jgi:alpha-beta hydrolase superfamily lysophospholipase
MILHKQGTFEGAGGVPLFCQSWHPTGETRAIFIIVHGLGGHSDLYGNIIQHLVPKGYAIYTYDHRGNGRSPGQRGYINSWDEFRQDLKAFLHFVETEELEIPRFLLGHSMGGLIVLDYVLRYPKENLQGVIALAPALTVGVSPLRMIIGKALSKLMPRFSLSLGIKLSKATRDKKVLAAYAQDSLRHNKATSRLAAQFLYTADWVQINADKLQHPLLILHGGADEVTLPQGSRDFIQKVFFADKQLKEYPESYHEIQDDFGHEEVIKDLEEWLEKHILSPITVKSLKNPILG